MPRDQNSLWQIPPMGLEEELLKVARPPMGQYLGERQGMLPPRGQCGPRVLLKGQGSQTEEEMGQWSLEQREQLEQLELPMGLQHSAPSGRTGRKEETENSSQLNNFPISSKSLTSQKPLFPHIARGDWWCAVTKTSTEKRDVAKHPAKQ